MIVTYNTNYDLNILSTKYFDFWIQEEGSEDIFFKSLQLKDKVGFFFIINLFQTYIHIFKY